MDLLFSLVIILAVLLALGLLWAYRLPKVWVIEEAVLLALPSEQAWALVKDFEAWSSWTVWGEVSEPKQVEAEEMLWSGRLPLIWRLRRLEPKAQHEAELWWGGDKLCLRSTLALSPSDVQHSQLAWRIQLMAGEGNKNPVLRIQSLILKNYFQAALKASFHQLKARYPLKA